MAFKMRIIAGAQMQNIVNERVHSLSARTNRAIGQIKGLNTKGKLNTPGLVKNHAVAAESAHELGRWEAIGRRVSR